MFHALAYFEALGTTADTDIAPVSDDVFLIQNSHFVPQMDVKLIAAAVMSATLSRVKIATPKTRQVVNPFLRPLIEAAIPPDNPGVVDYRSNPFGLKGLEEISILATSAVAMGTENFTALLLVGSGVDASPAGDIFTMRGTSTTTAVVNSWTQISMAWSDTLPQGTYACVGLQHESAGAQASRLIFYGQQFRPGALSVNALSRRSHPMFTKGGLGVYGRFIQTAMPLVEVLSNSADTSHEVYLDLIRVA